MTPTHQACYKYKWHSYKLIYKTCKGITTERELILALCAITCLAGHPLVPMTRKPKLVTKIAWTGSPNPIPNDGNLYYIATTMELPANLTINGLLKIIENVTVTNPHIVNVNKNGTFIIGDNAELVNNGTINISYTGSIISCKNSKLEINDGAVVNYYVDSDTQES